MQNRHHAHAPTDVMGIGRQHEDRISGRLDEQAVDLFLMPAREGPQFLRQRKDHMIIRDRQEFLFSRPEPCLGVALVAFRTTAVTAGVIGILLPTAVIALEYMASHRGRTASEYVCEGAAMTGGHLIAKLLQVLRAVASQDISYFDHGGSTADH